MQMRAKMPVKLRGGGVSDTTPSPTSPSQGGPLCSAAGASARPRCRCAGPGNPPCGLMNFVAVRHQLHLFEGGCWEAVLCNQKPKMLAVVFVPIATRREGISPWCSQARMAESVCQSGLSASIWQPTSLVFWLHSTASQHPPSNK